MVSLIVKKIISCMCAAMMLCTLGCGSSNGVTNDNEVFTFKELVDKNPVKESKYKDNEKRTLYTIEGALDKEKKIITAKESINYINRGEGAIKDMAIHLYADSYNSNETKASNFGGTINNDAKGDIKINSVKVNGREVDYTEENQLLKFALSSELKQGEELNIEVEFVLTIPNLDARLGYVDDDYSLTNWYPIVSVYDSETNSWNEKPYYPIGESNYAEYADYNVIIEVPEKMIVAGIGVESEEIKDGKKRVTMKEENIKDFVLFISPNYEYVTTEVDGITINNYYFKGNKNNAERLLKNVEQAMVFYNKTLGKYPYKEIDIIETHMAGGAMEYPTAIQMGLYNRWSLDSEIKEENLTWIDSTVVHELVHQWWYGVVGNNQYEEAILDEGFTTFWTTMYFEYTYGKDNPEGMEKQILKNEYLQKLLPINRPVDEFANEGAFYITVYDMAAIVLEDLRRQVGDEKFLELFREYYNEYKFKNATFDGFLEIVNKVCGEDMEKYVRDAFNGTEYDINKVKMDSIKDKAH